ncbi:MAG TPA: DUF4430 domain-containing protein [Solirubrobacteraceae bacterium]|jgi:hypothetical protein|nr:DUF4430 domain-containing protein [Solirubrobacteraceae bacterium]
MSGRRRLSIVAGALTLALTGCGLGAGPKPEGAALQVTENFGALPLAALAAPRVAGQETAMSLLERNERVTTHYGGGFVESINGRSGGIVHGHPVDWFYYVDGILASQGAADTVVHNGERIWWDLHDWSVTDGVPAVVGSFPEPFLHGVAGQRPPVAVRCVGATGACGTVLARLRAIGAQPTTLAREVPPPHDAVVVLVGTLAALRGQAAIDAVDQGPRTSGVYVTAPAAGTALELLDEDGAPVRRVTGDVGLVAATSGPGALPVWLVSGTDAAGVQAAASMLDERDLTDRYALVVAAGAHIAVPTATR